jgi:hypothetical protein
MSDARHPWREVTGHIGPKTGRGSVLGPDTWRRNRWWVLTLSCDHSVERTARYRPLPKDQRQRGGSQSRDIRDVLPAPRRVRCEHCPKEMAR